MLKGYNCMLPLVCVLFGLVILQNLALVLFVRGAEPENGFLLSGLLSVPVSVLVVACWIITMSQACGHVTSPVAEQTALVY